MGRRKGDEEVGRRDGDEVVGRRDGDEEVETSEWKETKKLIKKKFDDFVEEKVDGVLTLVRCCFLSLFMLSACTLCAFGVVAIAGVYGRANAFTSLPWNNT